MRLVYQHFAQQEWARLIAQLAPITASQTWEWGQARIHTAPWAVERGVFQDDSGRVLGAVQTLVRRLPLSLGGLAYVNRAPIWHIGEAHSPELTAEAIALLREHWVARRRMVLRVAPPLRSGSQLALEGFSPSGPGWASMEIDLSRPPDELRLGMKQKWRNCLYKAERSGAYVRIGSDEATLERFLDVYQANLERRGLEKAASPEFLRAVQPLLPPERKLLVLEACHEGSTAAWAVLARYGDSAEYIAGLTLPEGRPLNAGQLLIWAGLERARELGLKRFDLGGVDPAARESGIAHFKAGAGGTPYRLCPEVEAHPSGPAARVVNWVIERRRSTIDRRSSEQNRPTRAATPSR